MECFRGHQKQPACKQDRSPVVGRRLPSALLEATESRGPWGEGRPGARRVPLASPQPHRPPTKTPTPLLPLPAECQNHTQAPSVHLLPPTPQGLWLLDKAEFTCLATGEAPLDARFSWEVNGQPHGGALEEGPTWHMNSSWSQSSRLALPRSLWASGSNVTCTLSGPCLRSPVTLMAQREHGEGSRGPHGTPATSFPRGPTPWSPSSRA